jgi:predicted amidohydrolase
MARTVSIAACNFAVRPVGSFDEFADHARGLLDQTEAADLVLFPELFTVELFTTFSDWKDAPTSELTRIDKFTGDYLSLFESEAKERGQFIVAARI